MVIETFEVIETFVKIFNRSDSNLSKIYNFLYLVDPETIGKLKEEIFDWKAKSIDKICITANVEVDILGNTFILNSKQRGNHWICFVIDITKAKIYYYDSLGRKIPLNLNKTIEFIIALVKDCYQCFPGSFFLESVHCEKTNSRKTKKSNQVCYQNAPFQGPSMQICGVICLISTFLIEMTLLITIQDCYQKVSGSCTKCIIIVIMQDMFSSNDIFKLKLASQIF